MKLSLKFSLSVILLIAAVLSLGCVLFLQQDFDENIRQAKTAAAQEHSRQANTSLTRRAITSSTS